MKNAILVLILALFMGAGCDYGIDWSLDDWDWDWELDSTYYVEGVIADKASIKGIEGVTCTHKWISSTNGGVVHYEKLDGSTNDKGQFRVEVVQQYPHTSYLLIDSVLLNDYQSDGYVNGIFVPNLFSDGIAIGYGHPNNYRIGLVKK